MKLKKEGMVAIFIGLLIGLLIAGGVIRARTAFQNQPKNSTSNQSPSASNKPDGEEQTLFLEITAPADNTIAEEPKVTVTGRTNPENYVAIVAEKSEHLIVPNDIGQFSQEIALIGGANTVKITVYTATGEKVEKTLNIVYTTAEI